MRAIQVSTDVFARIWTLRRADENTEDEILHRFLGCQGPRRDDSSSAPPTPPSGGMGFYDARHGVHFAQGFEIFRTYLGVEYRAQARDGSWVLQGDGRVFRSLNELSRAIGAKTENAWVNWLYRDQLSGRRPVADLRDPKKIATRRGIATGEVDTEGTGEFDETFREDGTVTWRDDVKATLSHLGGKASLHSIYREIKKERRNAGRSVPRTLEAVVRRTLEDHSSDSDNYRGGLDLFYMPEGKGVGVWALRPQSNRAPLTPPD